MPAEPAVPPVPPADATPGGPEAHARPATRRPPVPRIPAAQAARAAVPRILVPPRPALPVPPPVHAEPTAVRAEPTAPGPEPVVPDPAVSELVVSELVVSDPAVSEAVVPDPAVSEPAVPARTEPRVRDDRPPSGEEDSQTARGDVLVLRGVGKSFGGRVAVDDVDLAVPAGTFFGLVGPNGAGKTTTLSMIAGLLRCDRGSIRVHDIDVTADPVRAKHMMGILPDRLRTFDRLTGRQLLYYDGVLRGLDAGAVHARVDDLAGAFGLADALDRTVADCSAGVVRTLQIAGALIHSPRLLVLDEPFEAVDPVSSGVILDVLHAYVRHGGSIVLSSHGMELVERTCSRVAIMVDGRIAAEGPTADVRAGATLQERFLELTGPAPSPEDVEWLHSFSE